MAFVRLRSAQLSALLLILFAPEARAGWVQPAGSYYLKVWDRTLIGNKTFDLHGDRPELPSSYQDHALNYYLEYGVTPETTVVLHGSPIGFSSIGDASTIYSGLNQFGLRFALLQGDVAMALQLDYGYSPPLGDKPLSEGTVGGVRFIYRPSFEQHLARGEVTAGAAAGPIWVKGGAAAIFSSGEDIDPALEAQLAGGWISSFGLAVSLDVVVHVPTRTPRLIDVTGIGNTRYLGVELTLSWWLSDHFAVNAGVGGAPALTRSNAATPALSFGVEIRS